MMINLLGRAHSTRLLARSLSSCVLRTPYPPLTAAAAASGVQTSLFVPNKFMPNLQFTSSRRRRYFRVKLLLN